MPLKIIYGTAGTGKTKKCFEYIENIINSTSEKVIYVVPEQYSLDAERNISAQFSKKALDRVEVLSLERLAKRVFSTVGPVMCDFVDDNAKLMIVEKAIIKVSGKFTYFAKSADTTGFSADILDLIKLMKKNCVEPHMIKTAAEETDDTNFKYKLYDLYLIYNEYNNFFKFPYADSDNNMELLAEKIKYFSIFRDTHFIFDNFVSFSKQQLMVVTSLMKHTPCVIVTLTTDDLTYNNQFQVFYKSKLTADTLLQIAFENNIQVLPNVYLYNKNKTNNEFDFLVSEYFANVHKKYTEATKNLFICKSGNFNGEVEQVAHQIIKLVRENGYRFSDFAVVSRKSDVYNPIICDVFNRYNIFYNITEAKFSNSNFLYSTMLSIFNVIINKYSFDDVFNFIRSVFCDLDDESKFLLENYVREVGNREKLWKKGTKITFKGGFSDEEFKVICKSIEYVRKCFSTFTDKFDGKKNVSEIIDAYSEFLKYIDAESKIKSVVELFKENGNKAMAEEIVSVYNHIMDSLNQMSTYFSSTYVTFEKFYKILDSALTNTEIDTLPSGVDDVMITTIDRFQASKAKVVFVLGVNEGVIPRGYTSEGIFKDKELKLFGIEDDVIRKHCDENYVIYRLFTSASEKLYISYSTADNEGNGLSPSSIINNLKLLFPEITIIQNFHEKINLIEEVEGVLPTLNKVIKNNATGFWKVVSKWYKDNNPELYNLIINSKNYTNLPAKLQTVNVKNLYGESIKTSISRVEKYNQCQFAYFLRYGLNIDERKEFKIESRDYGTYMHEIIEKFSVFAKEYGWNNITRDLCFEKASEITTTVLNENLSEFYTESERQTYLFKKIVSAMDTVLWNITGFYKNSDYISLGYEVNFDENSEFKPIVLSLSDGTEVKLRGKVDRVDIRQTQNGLFVGIIDYKSSAKELVFEKILCGIQIQLPIYLNAICKNLEEKGNNVIPAAMLYYHIDNPVISGTKDMTDESILKKIETELKMKGIMNESSEIPNMFVTKKNATVEQLNKLCKTAYNQMKSALEKMIQGNININPCKINKSTACDYCPYGNICNFDTQLKDNKYRTYKNVKMEEFFDYVDEMDR